jgi:ribonuclease PH
MRGEKTYNIYSGDVMNPDLVKQGMEEKEYTGMLHKALECAVALHTFPKTTVDVFALILQSGGGDLAVVISCASMALADAGIVMYDLVPAVSLVWPFSCVLQQRIWHFFCIFTCILCLFY